MITPEILIWKGHRTHLTFVISGPQCGRSLHPVSIGVNVSIVHIGSELTCVRGLLTRYHGNHLRPGHAAVQVCERGFSR